MDPDRAVGTSFSSSTNQDAQAALAKEVGDDLAKASMNRVVKCEYAVMVWVCRRLSLPPPPLTHFYLPYLPPLPLPPLCRVRALRAFPLLSLCLCSFACVCVCVPLCWPPPKLSYHIKMFSF